MTARLDGTIVTYHSKGIGLDEVETLVAKAKKMGANNFAPVYVMVGPFTFKVKHLEIRMPNVDNTSLGI